MDPREDLVPRGGVQAALGDGPVEVGRDPVAPGLRPREIRLIQDHILAHRRVDLGDAVAHQAGTGDEHPLDGHG